MANAFEDAVVLTIEARKMGVTRAVASSEVQVRSSDKVDLESLKVTKRLLKSDEFDAISAADRAIHARLRSIALPSVLRKGAYLIPSALIARVDKEVEAYADKRANVLVPAFLAKYSALVEEDRKRLDTLWSSDNYPDAEQVAAQFYVRMRYVDFGTPGKLETIDRAMFERERDRVQKEWDEARDVLQDAMRTSFAQIVNHFVDRLSPDKSGKRKKFRDSMVTSAQEWLEFFKPRNVADDESLATLVDECKSLIEGVDPGVLRTNTDLREQVTKGMQELQTKTDVLLVEAPRRKINLEEE